MDNQMKHLRERTLILCGAIKHVRKEIKINTEKLLALIMMLQMTDFSEHRDSSHQ